jgi:hypothetical protein
MKHFSCLIAGLLTIPVLAADPAPVKIKVSETEIEFRIGDELLTTYHHRGDKLAKPYLWPMNAPGGIPVTRGWPMKEGLPKETKDHVHQKSAWFCHGDVIPEGIELKEHSADKNVKGVDFWSEGKGHGTIVCTSVPGVSSDGPTVWVSFLNEWRAPDGTRILDEYRKVTVHNLGDARLIAFDIDLGAKVCPITFGDTKEGSFGVRVNDEFRLTAPGSDGIITTAEGTTAKAPAKDNLPMWGHRSDWHDYSGSVDGKKVGIAIFDDPKNSQRARWHTRAYGLMAANPFGRKSFPDAPPDLFKLPKGEHLKLRYGILLHRGDAKEGKVAEHFAAFAKE